MASEKEIKDHYTKIHDQLTEMYYSNPDGFTGGKAEFDRLHGDNWQEMTDELRTNGYLPEPEPSLIDQIKDLKERIEILEKRG